MMFKEYSCFFVSPIGQPGTEIRKNSDLVMSLLLYPALTQCGFNTENIVRSDQLGTANIQTDMKAHLDNDELCIVDITGLNANVMYEYGYRRGLGKALIVIASEKTATPFDIAADRVVRYDLNTQDALLKLPDTIETLRRQVQDRIDQGFLGSTGNGSVADITARLTAIEKKLNDVLARPISVPATEENGESGVREIIQKLGSPIAAFNYALRGRDVGLAEALLPRLQTILTKDRYINEAVATVAALGSPFAASILKSEWTYISEHLTLQQQYEELGSYVSYCNRRDCELEEIEFVLREADRLLNLAESDELKAGVYNQINRICFGAYQTKQKNGDADTSYLEKAIAALNQAVSINPKEAAYFFNLATCFLEKGDKSSALDAITSCMNLESDNDDHLLLAYRIYKENGMNSEALHTKEKLRLKNPLKADALI